MLGVAPDPAHGGADDDALASVGPLDLEPVRLAWEREGWTVPDFTGRPIREVLVGLQGAGVDVRVEGSGHAVAQKPAPGERVALGDTVSVVFR